MYKCYLDGTLMYHPNMVDKLPLAKAKLKLEVNKAGTFNFTIYRNNQKYGSIQKMKSIVKVYDDNFRLFRGRVLNAKRGMYNELQVTCEGELAFLLDSKQRPYEFTGDVKDYFAFLVENHNAQVDETRQFKVGNVTVTDPNDYIVRANSNYPSTWDEIQDKLINKLGGYLWTREEDDRIYIDYLEDFTLTNPQKIKFGENLLNLEETIKGQDVATAIIPLGCKLTDEEGNETDERLTIAEVNDGVDYVYEQSAVDKYGWIYKVVTWDDVTVPHNLMTKAREELQNNINLMRNIEITAIDLHNVDLNIQSFRYGRYNVIESAPHDLNESLLTRKIEINLQDPKDGYLVLGDEKATFVDKQVKANKNIAKDGKDGKDGEDATTLRIDSSRGTVFKNNAVSTILSAVIYKGSKRITDIDALHEVFGSSAYLQWSWQRMDENTFGTILSTDSRIGDDGFTFTLSPNDVDTKVTFMCQLITD